MLIIHDKLFEFETNIIAIICVPIVYLYQKQY